MKCLLYFALLQLLLGLGQTSLVTFNWDERLDINEIRLEMMPTSRDAPAPSRTYRLRRDETSITVQLAQPSLLSSVTAISEGDCPPKVYIACGLPSLIDAIEHHEITLSLRLLQDNLVASNNDEPTG